MPARLHPVRALSPAALCDGVVVLGLLSLVAGCSGRPVMQPRAGDVDPPVRAADGGPGQESGGAHRQGGGPHGQRALPDEAFQACQNQAASAPCSVSHGDRAHQGTCKVPENDTRLACLPSGRPGGPPPGGGGAGMSRR
ncbi:hypothetical protein [Chondromyces crocatus]|uniref:Lipoprotein n=1 Tax=Chondromyces crocatus TaxID=52 RepID=A0A0K1EN05_CHOCO|nr:hypothetical protein [Chondromyces crocatus]AKT42013.1 uncharacterized protein CMC5_062350 [Chondromyces crocatus]